MPGFATSLKQARTWFLKDSHEIGGLYASTFQHLAPGFPATRSRKTRWHATTRAGIQEVDSTRTASRENGTLPDHDDCGGALGQDRQPRWITGHSHGKWAQHVSHEILANAVRDWSHEVLFLRAKLICQRHPARVHRLWRSALLQQRATENGREKGVNILRTLPWLDHAQECLQTLGWGSYGLQDMTHSCVSRWHDSCTRAT